MMSHPHTPSNSPASSVGNYQNQSNHLQLQQQFANTDAYGTRQDLPSTHHQQVMFMPQNPQVQFAPNMQQGGPFYQYSQFAQRPMAMMNSQHPQQSLAQQPVQHVTQMRQSVMPGPRFGTQIPPPFQQQPGFAQSEQQAYPVMPPEAGFSVPNMHPSYYHQLQMSQQQVPPRQDGAISGNRAVYSSGQIQANPQQWPMFHQQQMFPVPVYQQIIPARFPQQGMAIPRTMMPQVSPQVGLQPEMTSEADARPQSHVSEPAARASPFIPRPAGGSSIVYYDNLQKMAEAEEKAQSAKAATSKALAIIDPNTGENVLETLQHGVRPATAEALQIQSEFANKVTQRIAGSGKVVDLSEVSEAETRSQAFPGARPKVTQPQPEIFNPNDLAPVSQESYEIDVAQNQRLEVTSELPETLSKVGNGKSEETLSYKAAEFIPAAMRNSSSQPTEVCSEPASALFSPDADPVDSGVDLPLENAFEATIEVKETVNTPVEMDQDVVEVEECLPGNGTLEKEEEEDDKKQEVVLDQKPTDESTAVSGKSDLADGVSEAEIETDVIESEEDDSDRRHVVESPVTELHETESVEFKPEIIENVVAVVDLEEAVSEKIECLEEAVAERKSSVCESDKKEESVEPEESAIVASEKGSDEEMEELVENKEETQPELKDSKPKYNYEPGQWAPQNPEGKKVYSRDFLLQLQYSAESTQTPPGLPHLPEIIRSSMPPRDSPREQSFSSLSSYKDFADFMLPVYATGRSSMGRAPVKRNSFQKRPEPHTKVITIQRSEDIKLHKTDQAWKPASGGTKEDVSDPDMAKSEELYKRFRGILNKITPSTFDRLLVQIVELPIDTEPKLMGIIKIIFEKAIGEPKFVKSYSQLAQKLTILNVPSTENPEKTVSFRKLLLNRCQEEFEKDKEDELDIKRRKKKKVPTATLR